MPQTINLADEFAAPDEAVTAKPSESVDLAKEFSLPATQSVEDELRASGALPKKLDFSGLQRKKDEKVFAVPDLTQPIVDLPQLPEFAASEEAGPLTAVEKVGSVGAGVYNAGAKLVSSFTTLPNIALLLTTGGLGNAARLGSVPARRALVGIGAYFAGTMGKDAIDQIPEAKKVFDSPDASPQEKAEAVAAPVLTAAMSLMAALGAVHEARPELTKFLKDKTPAEAETILKAEALKTENAQEKVVLQDAANEIATKAQPAEAAPEPSVSAPAAEPLPTPEIDKLAAIRGGAEKLNGIKTALKSPGAFIQYSVWDVPPGMDRVLQADVIDPTNPQPGGNGSTNRSLLKELGIDAPPAPDWLPQGSYTLDEIKAEIAKGPPNKSVPEPSSLTPDAKALLDSIDKGGAAPAFISRNLERIARENGVEITDKMRPADVIDAIRKVGETKPNLENEFTPPSEVTASAPEIGLGAASPAEFQPVKEFQTSVKNAQMDAEAVARGQEPAMAQAAQKNGEVWQQAMKAIDENQNLPDELVAELKNTSRPISAVEQLVLGHRNIELQNEFNKAERNISEGRGTPDSLAADRATQERVLDELMDVRAVTKASGGSEVGRSLQIRQTQINEDFSLPTMMAERRVARGGAKLTPEEMDSVRKQHAEIEEAQRALDEHDAQQELDAAITTPDEATTQITKLENDIKDAAKSKSGDKLDQFKKRTQRRIEDLKKRVESGDFSKKPRKEIMMDEEASVLAAKLDKVKADFDAALEGDRFDRLSGIQKLKERALGTYDAARNLMTTGEFSFVLRQGKIAAASHPIMTARALPKAFQALFADEVTARAIDLQTKSDPIAATAIENGVHFAEEGAKLSAREETLASKLADKLPLLRNFNQAGRVFLNKLRIDLYKAMAQGETLSPEQGLALGKYVNESTGRGSLGGFERSAVAIGRVLFAPRYLTSRIQYLTGHSMWGGDLTTRRIIAKEYAKTLVGLGVYYASLTAAFNAIVDKKDKKPVVTLDPRSTDFGKVRLGDTRLDPLAGLSQVIVFGARTATGEKTNAKGIVTPIRGNVPYGGQKWSDVAATFARSKLHPLPGAAINLFNGTDLAGNPATIQSQAANLVAPLTYVDIYQALEEQDLPEGVSLSLLSLLGEGLQTYKNTKLKKQMGQPAAKK